MKLVIIESPFSGSTDVEVQHNIDYALECFRDSLERREAPFASHLIYTEVLDDNIKEERMKGIICGFAWMERCDIVAVYADLGISPGMQLGIHRAKELNKPVEMRFIHESEVDK